MCGVDPRDAPFNDEHIVPDWLLRRFELHSRTITLPNGTTFPYGRYKVPCCVNCNSLLGKYIETPVSTLLAKGADAVCDYLRANGNGLLFVWLGLIFLKMHLRDRGFRAERDTRIQSKQISESYSWEYLHHLHCVVRLFYTGARISPGVLGTFVLLPYRAEGSLELFDYGDVYFAQTMFVRIDDIAMYAVFNDANGALIALRAILERIDGPLNELQAREVLAELSFVNHHLAERPVFRSVLTANDEYALIADMPEMCRLGELDMKIRGDILYHVLKRFFTEGFELHGLRGDDASELVREGEISFLFDDNGAFIHNGRPV